MRLVRMDLVRGKDAAYRAVIGDVVYENDRFRIGGEHGASDFIVDRGYLGITRTDDCMVIQVMPNEGRDGVKKRAFYKAVADDLHERRQLRRGDVFISLIEVQKGNWSFGKPK